MRKVAEYINVRNQKKIEQVKKLESRIHHVRTDINKNLKSKDDKTRLISLIVGLIDYTYERVGNDESAENGHYGITGFKRKHVTVKNDHIELNYVGKSNVKHRKKITDSKLIQALKDVIRDKKNDDDLFVLDNKKIRASDVNQYLEKFKVTSKDIRGFHANHLMNKNLQEQLKKNPIPEDATDKRERKKEIYNKALKETARLIGHKATTLKTHYLLPTIIQNL